MTVTKHDQRRHSRRSVKGRSLPGLVTEVNLIPNTVLHLLFQYHKPTQGKVGLLHHVGRRDMIAQCNLHSVTGEGLPLLLH